MLVRFLLVVLAALALFAAPASAQPCEPAIKVDGHGEVAHLAAELDEVSRGLYDRAQRATGSTSCAPIAVHLVQDNAAARSLLPAWHLPPWAAGAARPDQRTIVLTVHNEGLQHDRERVLLHELAHLAITDAAGERVPRWFDEGVARRIAGEDGQDDDRVLAEAKVGHRLLPLEGLKYSFPAGKNGAAVAYAVAGRGIELLEAEDPQVVRALLGAVRGGAEFEDALLEVTGRRTWKLSDQVHESVAVWHAWMTVLREVDIFMGLGGVVALFGGIAALRRRRRKFDDMADDAPLPLVAASQGIRVARWSSVRRWL
jgi:hypothetical protein